MRGDQALHSKIITAIKTKYTTSVTNTKQLNEIKGKCSEKNERRKKNASEKQQEKRSTNIKTSYKWQALSLMHARTHTQDRQMFENKENQEQQLAIVQNRI